MDALTELQAQLAVLRVRMRRDANGAGRGVAAAHAPVHGTSALSPAERAPNPSLRDPAGENPMMVVELEVDGQPVGKWRLTAQELGFPLTAAELEALRDRLVSPAARGAGGAQTIASLLPAGSPTARIRRQLRSLRMPARVADGIRDGLARHASGRSALWLEISEPAGYLPLIGWESVLRDAVRLPVLRLPHHPVDAGAAGSSGPGRPLDVLLCCTAPYHETAPPAAAVRTIVRQILAAVPEERRCTVHVFADSIVRRALAKHGGWSTDPAARGAVLHELPSVAGGDRSQLGVAAAARAALSEDHPWGNWIGERLGGRGVDVFHLVAPGTLFAHDAAAVVAWTPAADVVTGAAGQPVVRFAAASDLHGLSARFGAWATVLSAYGTDVSRIALRVVADQIARSRPGPVALHDVARDRTGHGAAALYRFLQAPPPADVPADRAVSLYTHPARVGVAAPTTQVAPGLAEAFRNVAAATGRAAPEGGAQEALPSWLGAAQRYLEQCASSSLKEQPRTAADHAAHEGVVSALSFLSNVVAGAAERSVGRGAHTEES